MIGLVVDTSIWIDFLAGNEVPALEDALARGVVVVPPLVMAELMSGARREWDRAAIARLMKMLTMHDTPAAHWLEVGNLRRGLREKGLSVSIPDAHIAQCAIDRGGQGGRGAPLLTRDAIFRRIAELVPLRLL